MMTARSKTVNVAEIPKNEPEVGSRPYWLRLIPLVFAAAAVSTTILPTEFFIKLLKNAEAFWLEGGRIRQSIWNDVLQVTGTDPWVLYGLMPLIVSIITYWSVGMLYILMDIYLKPKALRKYKVQPGTNEPVDREKLTKAILQVLFNQTIVTFPITFLFNPIINSLEMPDPHILPPFYVTVLHVIGCVFAEEFGFYYAHRIMHHKSLYKHFHKQHHEWTAPISVIALYNHPLEHVVSNLFPAMLGVLLFRCHPSTTWLWFFLANAYTVNEHSGYHLPFLPSAEYHDYHHLKFNNNYGVLGILDYLHGTDLNFKSVMAGKRHRVLTDLRSAREVYPDSPAEAAAQKARVHKKQK